MRSKKIAVRLIPVLLIAFLGSYDLKAGGLDIPGDSNGGKICKVTTLVDGNFPGTLRRAMENGYNIKNSEQPSFCTEKIIFEVSGTITLKSPLVFDNPAAQGFTLEKAGGTSGDIILDASNVGEGNCGIVIDSDQVTIKGISVRNGPECGILIRSGSNQNSIEDTTVSNSKHGVVIESGSQNNVITNSKFFDNTGYGVKMADATQNLVSKNALYRNGAGPIDSPATDLQPTIESVSPSNGAATTWTIFGSLPTSVGSVEIYRGAPTSGSGETNYITEVVDVSTNTFQIQVEARAGEEVFAIGIAADGTTSPNSQFSKLTVTGSGGTGPGTGDRPCFPGQEFPPTSQFDWDGDGIPDALEDVNKNCVADPGETDAANSDTDGDGLNDGIEDRNKNGQVDPEESDPRTQDTDGDTIPDGVEDKNGNGLRDSNESAAYSDDTDGDGIKDNREDMDKDGEWDEGTETKAYDSDTDFDGLPDGVEDTNKDGVHDRFRESDPRKLDTDGDFNPDSSDACPNIPYATCKTPCIPGVEPDPEADDDGDGLPNFIEDRDHSCGNGLATVGDPDPGESHPYKKDSDGDGKNDGVDLCPNDPDPSCEGVCDPELINEYTDSDLDGVVNSEEDLNGNCFVDANESDPFDPDSDKDGVNDGEDQCPLDPNPLCDTPCQVGVARPEGLDSDGDGIEDRNEDIDKSCGQNGNETDFRKRDTDGDGLNDNVDPCPNNSNTSCTKECVKGEYIAPGRDSDNDGIEDVLEDTDKDCKFETGETDAYNSDSDADGIPDGVEDFNRNGVVDDGETDPRNPDTDGDGLLDGVEDKNFNGRKDFNECDPLSADTDGDGILDFNEDTNLNGTWDAGETKCDKADTDQDGLDDGAEDLNHNGFVDAGETDPRNPDTDGDGATDGQEVQNGTNPINASSKDLNRAIGKGCALGATEGVSWNYFSGLGMLLLAMAGLRFRRSKN